MPKAITSAGDWDDYAVREITSNVNSVDFTDGFDDAYEHRFKFEDVETDSQGIYILTSHDGGITMPNYSEHGHNFNPASSSYASYVSNNGDKGIWVTSNAAHGGVNGIVNIEKLGESSSYGQPIFYGTMFNSFMPLKYDFAGRSNHTAPVNFVRFSASASYRNIIKGKIIHQRKAKS